VVNSSGSVTNFGSTDVGNRNQTIDDNPTEFDVNFNNEMDVDANRLVVNSSGSVTNFGSTDVGNRNQTIDDNPTEFDVNFNNEMGLNRNTVKIPRLRLKLKKNKIGKSTQLKDIDTFKKMMVFEFY
jgi:hypothetical protein